jgi:UTP--glucose-1-phosphate uridylyltransferase
MLMMAQPSCLRQMMTAYDRIGGNVIAVEETDTPELYGVIDPEAGGREGRLIKMRGMVEKPPREKAPSNLFISGRYMLQPEIFDLLEAQDPGAGGEIQLTDSMVKLMESQDFHAFAYSGRSYDCGDKVGYLRAVSAFALKNEALGAQARATLLEELNRTE